MSHKHDYHVAFYSPAQSGMSIYGLSLIPHESFSIWVCMCGAKKEVKHLSKVAE